MFMILEPAVVLNIVLIKPSKMITDEKRNHTLGVSSAELASQLLNSECVNALHMLAWLAGGCHTIRI